jgi:hypothetical protein
MKKAAERILCNGSGGARFPVVRAIPYFERRASPVGPDYQVSREFGGPMSILRSTSVTPRPVRDFPADLSLGFAFLAFFLGAFFFLRAMRPHLDLGPMDRGDYGA